LNDDKRGISKHTIKKRSTGLNNLRERQKK